MRHDEMITILAREMFVHSRTHQVPAARRRRWYVELGEADRAEWKERAEQLAASLAAPEIGLYPTVGEP